MKFLGDTQMADYTPKIEIDTQGNSDAKKSYVHPDVVDLLPVDETQGAKSINPVEDFPGPAFGS